MLQLTLAYFVMRSSFGYNFFKFLSEMMQKFLDLTDYGSVLVFGENYQDHFFAFKVGI
jgi:CNT family concentrative nucleoside transporter